MDYCLFFIWASEIETFAGKALLPSPFIIMLHSQYGEDTSVRWKQRILPYSPSVAYTQSILLESSEQP